VAAVLCGLQAQPFSAAPSDAKPGEKRIGKKHKIMKVYYFIIRAAKKQPM